MTTVGKKRRPCRTAVIRGPEAVTSFIGSANDSANAWTKNYELVWEDNDSEIVAWLQEEFDALWTKGFPLSEFIVKQLGRLARRTVIEHIGEWKENPRPGPVLAEVPTVTELFGFWDHQKYFISLGFNDHLKYDGDPDRGARFLLGDGVGLGKTLQLGAIAKLIAILDPLPILIVVPKTLTTQWQEELQPTTCCTESTSFYFRDMFTLRLPSSYESAIRVITIPVTPCVTPAVQINFRKLVSYLRRYTDL